MIVTARYHVVERFVALALALGLPAQQAVMSPHEEAGVGAAGTIGRGTIPEERPGRSDLRAVLPRIGDL